MLYTVKKTRRSWKVEYIDKANAVQVFNGSFGDPGGASQEFQACVSGEHDYLEPRAFNDRVKQIAHERQMLAQWNQMVTA